MRRPSQCAFTLVELLVIVALIALMAAMVLPSIGRARDIARRTYCGNNLHELARACVQFSGDARLHRTGPKRTLPYVAGVNTTNWHDPASGNPKGLWTLVDSGWADTRLFLCPAVHSSASAADKGTGQFSINNCDYSYQSMVTDPADPALKLGPLDDLLANPGLVVLADKNPRIQLAMSGNSVTMTMSNTPMDDKNYTNSANHAGNGQMIACLDGSVKWADRPFVEALWRPTTGAREFDFIYQSDVSASDQKGKPDVGNGVKESQYKDIFLIP